MNAPIVPTDRSADLPTRPDAGAPRTGDRTAAPAAAGAGAALLALLLLMTALRPAPAAAQQDMEDVEIEVTHVAGDVYLLEGRGGNIAVSAGSDGVVMVDDQFEELAPKIRAAVDTLADDGLAFVLNTHWHGDHVGGNVVFGRDAPIVAHDNVRRRLATRQVVRGDTVPAEPEEALPVLTFDRSVTLHLNGGPIRVRHVPEGHTDGDAVVFFEDDRVVHMGDHMFAGRFPFVDLATGGSVQGYTRNVAAVLDEIPDDWAVVPGHGPLTDVEGLRAFHDMLVETTSIVRRRMERGMSLEEVREAGLPERWSSWGQGFISTGQWLETVYRSLQRSGDETARGGGAASGSPPWHPHGHPVASDRGGAHGHGDAPVGQADGDAGPHSGTRPSRPR